MGGPQKKQQQQQQQNNKKKGAASSDLKQEEKLQALILADSFDQRFAPITLETPRALLPLVNIPLIEYTVEFLAASGIKEIFIFCSSHAELIRNYVETEIKPRLNGIVLKCICERGVKSAGDALRVVHQTGVITSHFVLVSGDVIANIKLDQILQRHKDRYEKDKKTLLTMVFKKATPSHRTRSLEDDTVIAVDKQTGQLFHFDNSPESSSVQISLDNFLEDYSSISFRHDLIDCRIDICSPEVLYLFTDEFDWEDLRQQFVKGVLSSEILGNKIYTHVVSGHEYAARVRNLRTYDAVSKDIIYRWTYPMVPDQNWTGETSYSNNRACIYKENNVKLARDCVISKESVIGASTEVGSNSVIAQSVIGRRCYIGNNVTITNSFIWDDVIIEDGAKIVSSIICNKAQILQHAVVSKGCIVSYKVVVGSRFVLPPETKLTTQQRGYDNEEEEERAMTESIDMGPGSVGYRWICPEQEKTNSLLYDAVAIVSHPDDEFVFESQKKKKQTTQQEEVSDDEKFKKEIQDTIKRGIQENHQVDTIVLEINALKFAYDRSFVECATVIITTLLEMCNVGSPTPEELKINLQRTLKKWSGLMKKFVRSTEDQIEVILEAQEYCEKHRSIEKGFVWILHTLYNCEVLDEDTIFDWESRLEGDEQRFAKQCEKFLKWLREAEEE
eukprot:TRINITY_DN6807_c0_g1_i2.p1 TRINITY_DN6807_c0_g1~~TRINITY_DN6807_c0_g1_i2.p1  ORF type:complete len:673 (-),score=125.69 TRINITY_DN6807_c0_g1_i2:49-2067(-)